MPRILAPYLSAHHEVVWLQLMNAMTKLLSERPYDQIRLSDIAATAGLARNTLYNYAADKPALLAAASIRAGAELFEIVGMAASRASPPDTKLSDIVRIVLTWFAANPHRNILLTALFEPVSVAVQHEASVQLLEMLTHVSTIVAEGIQIGHFRDVRDQSLIISLMGGVMHPAVRRVAKSPAELNAVVEDVTRFLLCALRH